MLTHGEIDDMHYERIKAERRADEETLLASCPPDRQESAGPDPDPSRPTAADVFTIDSDAAANWLLRKLANIEAEKARVSAQAGAILNALDADAQRLTFLYGAQLEQYCRSKIAAGRGKTVRFLQGTCAIRSVPACVRIVDFSAALHFVQESGLGMIRHVAQLDTTAYRSLGERHFTETGELLPGMDSQPEREAFSIRTGK